MMRAMLVLCLASTQACTVLDAVGNLPPPPSETQRQSLGSIELCVEGEAPAMHVGVPRGPWEGFTHGATRLGLLPVLIGVQSGMLEGLALGAALSPAFALGGGIWGAAEAPVAADVERAEQRIEAILGRAVLSSLLHREVSEQCRAQTRLELASSGRGQTRLRVAVERIGLTGPWLPEDKLRVFCRARARLMRVADGSVLHEITVQFESLPREFTAWLDESVRAAECEHALRWIASAIVEQMFLVRRD